MNLGYNYYFQSDILIFVKCKFKTIHPIIILTIQIEKGQGFRNE